MSVLHSPDFQSTLYRSVHYCVEWGGNDWYGLHVERRGQLLGAGFLLTLCVSRDQAQVTRLMASVSTKLSLCLIDFLHKT